MSFSVVILGRPNVGKSTLFNRLVGRSRAIVGDFPGVTRDRRDGIGRIGPCHFRLTDTAGLESTTNREGLSERIFQQTERALEEADVALLIIDGRAGVTATDKYFAEYLRRDTTPVIVVVNKCEGIAASAGIAESYGLGLGEPVAISAEHNEGINDLYEALVPFENKAQVHEVQASRDLNQVLRLAIVGRPNVGKSTLFNQLLHDERVITGPEPGITRDSIAVRWEFNGYPIELIDTAGLRRRARIKEKVEVLSSKETLSSLGRAEVVLLLFDASVPPTKQDLGIANLLTEEGRAPVMILNKIDLLETSQGLVGQMRKRFENSLSQVRGVPLVPCSAITGFGCDNIMPTVLKVYKCWNSRFPTAKLNYWLKQASEDHPPPIVAGRRVKLRYATQIKARPPTFIIFASRPASLTDSYKRYLVNSLRDHFNLDGIPIRLYFRKGKNPYI